MPFIGRFIPVNPTPAPTPETEMSNAIGGKLSRGGSGRRYNASSCVNPQHNKIYNSCGSACPNGHEKVSSAFMLGC